MLFMSKDIKKLSKRDLDNGAIRESLFKTLRWYEALCASQQAVEVDAKVADMNKVYKLRLYEIYCPDDNSLYRRVPGGWVYEDLSGVCFVPFDNASILAIIGAKNVRKGCAPSPS